MSGADDGTGVWEGVAEDLEQTQWSAGVGPDAPTRADGSGRDAGGAGEVDRNDAGEMDYYAVLGVPHDATQRDIKAAYHRAMQRWHPDKATAEVHDVVTEHASAINKAYRVLGDTEQRMVYDRFGIKGLDDYRALDVSGVPAEELQDLFARVRRERDEEQERLKTRVQTTVQWEGNAGGVFFPEAHNYLPTNMLAFERLVVSHSVSTPVSNTDLIEFNGTVVSRGAQSAYSLVGGLRHTFSHATWSELALGIGSGKHFDFKSHLEAAGFALEGDLFYKWFEQKEGWGLSFSLSRMLTETISAQATLNLGFDESVELSLMRKTQNLALSTQFTIPMMGMMSWINRLSYDLSPRTNLVAGLGVTHGGPWATVGVSRWVSRRSKIGVNVEYDTGSGVVLKFVFQRSGQTFSLPIAIHRQFDPIAVAGSILGPLVVSWLGRTFVVVPGQRRRELRRLRRLRDEKRSEIEMRSRISAYFLLQEKDRAAEIRAREEARGGLVVLLAVYGNLSDPAIHEALREEEEALNAAAAASMAAAASVRDGFSKPVYEFPLYINVTVAVQVMVDEETAQVHFGDGVCKSQLDGFFDCNPGGDKTLYVRYLFQGRMHEVFLDETEEGALASPDHLVAGGDGDITHIPGSPEYAVRRRQADMRRNGSVRLGRQGRADNGDGDGDGDA